MPVGGVGYFHDPSKKGIHYLDRPLSGRSAASRDYLAFGSTLLCIHCYRLHICHYGCGGFDLFGNPVPSLIGRDILGAAIPF